VEFLSRVFDKLLVNFTWWVNLEDAGGKNVYEGGFLGLDNIGPLDRSKLPVGGILEQSDATGWMGFYAIALGGIATVLARSGQRPASDLVVKFLEHFAAIRDALDSQGLWDPDDGFYYDRLVTPSGEQVPIKVRSMVGMIPLLAAAVVGEEDLRQALVLGKQFADLLGREDLTDTDAMRSRGVLRGLGGEQRLLLSLCGPDRLVRLLGRLFDENEFLSAHGLRALSAYHRSHPYSLSVEGVTASIDYEPAESTTALFGGNSNWRGPVWFPLNYLVISSLERYHTFFGDDFTIEYPTGSGNRLTLDKVAADLQDRLISIFTRGPDGRRPCFGGVSLLQDDPAWRDNLVFAEYFHGDNAAALGAWHQTGWTGIIADVIRRRHGMVRSIGDVVLLIGQQERSLSGLARGVVPVLVGGEQGGGLVRAPAAPLVGMDRNHVAEHGIDDPPSRLDRVLGGEQPALPAERGADEPVVGAHVGAGVFGEPEFLGLGQPTRAGLLADYGQGDPVFRVDPEPQRVCCRAVAEAERVVRRATEGDRDLGGGHRQALSGPDHDGHVGPAPGVRGEPDRGVGLGFRVRGHAFDLPVTVVLALDRELRGQGAQRADELGLAGPPGIQAVPVRGFGQDGGEDLQQVVLDHVPDGAGLVVEAAPVRDVERLGHRDLDALHAGPVQQRLDGRVREPDEHEAVDRFQAKPVVDAVDGVLGEVGLHGGVQLLGAGQVVTERLLDHDPAVFRAAGLGDALGDAAEQRWWHLEVEEYFLGLAYLVRHGLVRRRVAEVAVDVAQQLQELDRGRAVRVDLVQLQRRGGVVAELVQAPAALGHADHGHVEHTPLDQPDQRGEGLEFGQVAGGTEDHQRVNVVTLVSAHVLVSAFPGRRSCRPLYIPCRARDLRRGSAPVSVVMRSLLVAALGDCGLRQYRRKRILGALSGRI
jgi:hypothetical protein